ncbi:hypothetical protein H5410_040878 [Solanum commersonii]|uniref:Uncharacterized protein n=1 Tax=Solanum commersonii TaxID=4109 RepID=A0A9J5XST6_SOLCO|nr:hypothetical protein H5410_040878 [Solanum commersonii]
MNSFSLHVSQKPSPNMRENKKAKTLENSVGESLGEVSRERRMTRQLTLLIVHHCLCFCLQHLCILDHWVAYFWFTELIGEAPTAPLIPFLILLLLGFAYWNKGWSASLQRSQACLAMLKLQLLRSFQPFCSFLHLCIHTSTKTSNT